MAGKPLRAPFIPFDLIRVKADEFRSIHFAGQEPPLDIEAVIEFDLGVRINPVRGLREDYDMDALLLGTLDEVIVDEGEYMNDRMRNRLRFSLAHEIAHRELHRNVYAACQVQSVADWMDLVQAIPEDDYAWMEAHANEFAGRLLVPREMLQREVCQAWEHTRREFAAQGMDDNRARDYGKEFIAAAAAKAFGVSMEVILRRLDREKLWPPAG